MKKRSEDHGKNRRQPEAKGTALVKSDALHRYMAEIRRYPLLSREEEYRLAVRYYETGDPDAAQQLVLGNLRLVIKIAFDFVRLYQNTLDLVQEGNIGLLQAVKKYNPFKGVKLSTYAAWWIRAYILKFIMNNYRIYKIGTTEAQKKLFYKLNQEMEKLDALGEIPSPKLLARHFDVRESDVVEMQQILKEDDLSLDAPIQDDSQTPLMHFFSSGERPVDERLAEEELMEAFREKLREFSGTLSEKEEAILQQRLLSDPPATLQVIGDAHRISRERVRQIEKRVMKKLKEYLAQFKEFDGIEIDRSS
ncbi:MAG: sigma-70 family RNA polymerase sigma factor [Deltaproteobacteria bacterium]|nr:sigma-70 family RNA polymerase sigma factor [Deltaproteobacteria bacterium]